MDASDQYPGAAIAISLCEQLQCWDMYLGVAVQEGVEGMRAKMRTAAQEAADTMPGERRYLLQEALKQWDHPDFLAYLKMKVGAT